ncbi:type VI secretion system baseplate subunit TssF [Serratia fonticola]|uniref:type VI secretion system baseplate subunit TssF n=1 Tax=Serratia fonticola TaxID=47917 RepID=UPI0034C5C1BC
MESFEDLFRDEVDYLQQLTEHMAADSPHLANFLPNSGDPDVARLIEGFSVLIASLRQKIEDDFDGEPLENKTKLYAVSGDFDTGFIRLNKFFSILKTPEIGATPQLVADMESAVKFIEEHRNSHFLLETIELDTMTEIEEARLKACVEEEIENCLRIGTAVDALPDNKGEAAKLVIKATQQECSSALGAFFGLRFDDDCDNAYVDYPLGISEWSETLYFGLWDRAEFEANSY